MTNKKKNKKKKNNKKNSIEQIIKETLEHPTTVKNLIKKLKIEPNEHDSFSKTLENMVNGGTLVKIKDNMFGLSKKMGLVTGTLQGHADGFGFVIPETEGDEDVFIKNRAMGNAMHGDKVICRVESIKGGSKREGTIIRILDRAHEEVVGIYEESKHFGFVIASEKRIFHDIFITKGNNKANAKNSEVVLVKISKYPESNRSPEGKIVEVLGDQADPNVEVEVAIKKYGLKNNFPSKVIDEAQNIPSTLSKSDLKGRLDLRKKTVFTIDGETAKDFDDAVSISKTKNGNLELGVHIADVSHYVKEFTEIDKEAFDRSTSVYFPDRVIPMLPFSLSNEMCSLKPKVDRLALSIFMEIDKAGKLIDYKIAETIINSKERLTYTKVSAIIEKGDEPLKKEYAHILDDLYLMEELRCILREKRTKGGSIDFDLPEAGIILDLQGRPENIIKIERNSAHLLIEEFMLYANVSISKHLKEHSDLSIYRIHEKPTPEKVLAFKEFIYNFGYDLKGAEDVSPKIFQEILSKVKGKPEERLFNTIMLRSMKQAKYSINNVGHFGLSFSYYTHFTSPIRRYPDLIIHRLVKKTLNKKGSGLTEERLSDMCIHTSTKERKAEEAEREIVDIKRIQFMEDKVLEEFDGFISGVTSFGLFVELEDYFVEGLIHVSSMADDYYTYLENEYCLMGQATKKRYVIGNKIRVRVVNVSVSKREMELVLV